MLAATTVLALPGLSAAAPSRRSSWAEAIPLDGVPNFHRVTPLLYRGAQPSRLGFRKLHDFGIRTVVSLRQTRDDAGPASAAGLISRQIRMKTRYVQEDDAGKIVLALHYVRQGLALGPTFVHCTHGADRTGLIIALWRILDQGWTRDEAIDEMRNGGFGFHRLWSNIPAFISAVDLDDLRERIG